MTHSLPIYEIIPDLKRHFLTHNNAVLQAPPGAGKTTVVPLELLTEKWLKGKKIIMLEPRRLAARAAARRMAETLGEKVGQRVGYRVRMDNKVSPDTKIEVVTEGVLIRKLQSDPELSDVGLIIFDEFHERSIEADLGLALGLDIQEGLRDDLKILVMSATLDGKKVATLMGDVPLLTSEGRSFPVIHKYINIAPAARIEEETAAAILKALDSETGSILVFLPGAREIERTKKLLEQNLLSPDILLCPLYGMMPFSEQDRAIEKAPEGKRKIVLSTAIAETSLTIEGIRIVIDSGLQRYAAHDLRSGMTRLQTSKVSKASADQRAGRAGRLEEGVCYRLWSEASNRALVAHGEPEIARVDLTPLALDLALWGIKDAGTLKWLDVPDQNSLDKAKELLMSLEALDVEGRITDHGKMISKFPMHPRFAHMITKAKEQNLGMTALMVAALLEERDILRLGPDQRTVDLRLRIEALLHVRDGELKQAAKLGCNVGLAKNILRQVKIWAKRYSVRDNNVMPGKIGICLAIAFPDRIAALRAGQAGSFILSGGRGAILPADDPIATERFLSVGHLDLAGRDARIFLAAPIEQDEIEENFAAQIKEKEVIKWDPQSKTVKTERKRMLQQMPLSTQRLEKPDGEKVKSEMIKGIKSSGIDILPWDKKSRMLRKRASLMEQEMPQFSDEILLNSLEDWLGPYLDNVNSLATLQKLDMYPILKNILSWEQQRQLDELVPTHITVPSGSNIAVDYESDPPALSVKLQEMFGATETPAILGGKLKLSLHLLSPAQRPLQITKDLKGFWKSSYHDIKKEMKGRYPKHPWPDDPLEAPATRKAKQKK